MLKMAAFRGIPPGFKWPGTKPLSGKVTFQFPDAALDQAAVDEGRTGAPFPQVPDEPMEVDDEEEEGARDRYWTNK